MGTPNQYSRRLFLQRAVLVSVAAAGGGPLLTGCASGGGGTSSERLPDRSAGHRPQGRLMNAASGAWPGGW